MAIIEKERNERLEDVRKDVKEQLNEREYDYVERSKPKNKHSLKYFDN